MSPLNVERVRAALAGSSFSDVRFLAETTSTNDDAAPLLGDPSAAGATMVAEFQSAGRGRKPGRAWVSAAGSALTFTTLLPDALETAALWAVPFWLALAVVDGVEAASGVRLDVRWPNDLDLGRRKAGGLLCISRVAGPSAHVGCGVGLNVRRPADGPAAAIEPPPAYLSDANGSVEREQVLTGVLRAMDALLPLLARPDQVARAWERRAWLPGRRYRLRLDRDGSTLEGPALRLDGEGGLVVQTADGERAVHLADARVLDTA